MRFLRYLSLVTLALWIGGAITLGAIAAPAVFAALSAQDPALGRATAGVVFGAVLHRFQQASWVLGGLLLASYGVRAALGPRPRRMSVRVWTVLAMLVVSLGSDLVVAPRIETLRRDLPGNLSDVAETDARRIAFGRMHALSTALMGLTVIAGLGLLWAETHD